MGRKSERAGPHPIGQKGQLVKRSLGPKSQVPDPESPKKLVQEMFWNFQNMTHIILVAGVKRRKVIEKIFKILKSVLIFLCLFISLFAWLHSRDLFAQYDRYWQRK